MPASVANHPGRRVWGIGSEGRNYKVGPGPGLELKFNRKFRLTGMDE